MAFQASRNGAIVFRSHEDNRIECRSLEGTGTGGGSESYHSCRAADHGKKFGHPERAGASRTSVVTRIDALATDQVAYLVGFHGMLLGP